MKRKIISAILSLVICFSSLVMYRPEAKAATENVKIVGADFYAVGAFVYCDFYLDRLIKPARNFQTTDRKEEPSDFPDAMVEQAITHYFINDISISDYSDAFDGSQYVIMLHIENMFDNSASMIRVLHMGKMIPGASLNDAFTVKITDGFITSEYLKINPFVATYDPKTKKVTLVQEGGNPTPTAGPVQSSSASSSSASSSKTSSAASSLAQSQDQSQAQSQDSSAAASSGESVVSADSQVSGTSSASSSTEVITGNLGSFDITSLKTDAVIDFPAKTITLAKSMKVQDLTGMLDVLEGLTLKFFSGAAELTAKSKLQNSDLMKVYKGEQLLGEFTMTVPVKESSNTWLIVLMIILAVVLIGGSAFYLFFLKNKNKPN